VASSAAAIRTIALSKSYGKRLAVDHLDLEVERAELFGFLGPNGAGKTTTIRMALGLIAPTGGSVEVLGLEVRSHRAQVLPRVGALVESPALYGYLSGRDNLRAVGNLLGGASEKRIDEVLEIVSLKGRDRDRVRTYSMGMKQRLGLAMALLNDPDVLILDEPANGLDPAGIVEMRDLLRDLAARGKTVFISSHVLAEVQQICTRVAIINYGRLVRLAPVHDLLQSSGEFEVKVDAPAGLVATLRLQPWAQQARVEDGVVITPAPEGRGRNLIKFLVESGYVPDAVSERHKDLEDIFLSLTGQGGAPGTGFAGPGASRGEFPPQEGGAPGAGFAGPGASRGEFPPQKDS
jgi:ABC-2 type transport system ATP-binding protein